MDSLPFDQKYFSAFESSLEKALFTGDESLKPLYDAMRYTAAGGGKRLRAGLVFGFYEAAGGEDAFSPADYAAAVELIHAASLIHDDLPVMDDDDYRRGKLTNHKVYGEDFALIAGDALFIKAFETAAKNPHCGETQNLRAVSVLARAAGPDGMAGGQMLDISFSLKNGGKAQLKKTHLLKTASLISASCALGCVAAGADEEQILAAEEYGKSLGLAFQIYDDILDVTGSKTDMGKTPGKDEKQRKLTYPALYGLENSRAMCGEYTKKAVDSLFAFKNTPALQKLKCLAERLLERKS